MIRRIIVLMLAGALPALAMAVEPIPLKPGLWEQVMTMASESGRVEATLDHIQQQLEALPPEQRNRMKDMMESQGISIESGISTVQICLTQQDINVGGMAAEQEGCQQKVLEQDNQHLRLQFACGAQSGEGEIVFHNAESYSGATHMTARLNDQQEALTITQDGKWLGADCGALGAGK
ncbi:MAG: DUF3617 domain-containing protein [Chromatiales bacterium]|nr:DUF3617 domain-containing protein [Chromatiales bacterium]